MLIGYKQERLKVSFCQCFPSDPPMDALLKCSSWRQGVWLRSDPEEEGPCGAADPLLSPRASTEPHEDMHPSESGMMQILKGSALLMSFISSFYMRRLTSDPNISFTLKASQSLFI